MHIKIGGVECQIISEADEIFRSAETLPTYFLVRLVPRECRPDAMLEKNRDRTQHIAWVVCLDRLGNEALVEVRKKDGSGWTDRSALRYIVAEYHRSLKTNNSQ
jgi:hypothetical protein